MLLLGKGLLMSKAKLACTRDVFADRSTGAPRGTARLRHGVDNEELCERARQRRVAQQPGQRSRLSSEATLRDPVGSTKWRWAALIAVAITAFLVPAHAAFAATLELDGTIRTSPFTGSSVSMGDNEGSAFVPSDNSLWLADDGKKQIYEVDAATGALKRTIARSVFNNAPRLGGGPAAGTDRTNDFESIAYDRANDALYVFSGKCCTSSILPTAFRLTRQSGQFQVESYQPLPTGADYTGSAWSPTDGKIYVGKGRDIRSFDFASGIASPSFRVGGVSGITGMDFSPDGADLFATLNSEKLIRINWATKTVVSGWTFDLTPFGIRDSRAVAEIGNQFFVSDGYDSRPKGDPLRHAVYVFDATT
jgi:DNA-binding beta-propeller fold protein YncE